jgi:hypothetical protein
MKNIFKILLSSLMIVSFSCAEDDTVTSEMLDTFENGGALRTVEIVNDLFNSSDPTSAFTVVVEAQDEQDGGLMQEVRVLAEFVDFTGDFITPPTGDALVQTIPASNFEIGEFGLPRTTISVTFQEAADALGLALDVENGYQPGDVFRIKLELVLTDGRVFGPSSAASIITGGFFSSPFQYNGLISCSPEPGTYSILMYDNYGDGWQTGDYNQGLAVSIDGVTTMISMCSQWGTYAFPCEATADGYFAETSIEVPVGTSTLTWSWPGDQYGEIALAIVGPGDSGTLFGTVDPPAEEYGTVPVGLLPITLCAE